MRVQELVDEVGADHFIRGFAFVLRSRDDYPIVPDVLSSFVAAKIVMEESADSHLSERAENAIRARFHYFHRHDHLNE